MSLRNRARRLQRVAGVCYQEAVTKLRALGEAPAVLAKRSGWALVRCDAYLVDPALDEGWREVSARSTTEPPQERTCQGCQQLFFAGDLERASNERRCPACRFARTRLRWSVQPPLTAPPASAREICERLLERACAGAALWIPREGPIVRAGELDAARMVALAGARSRHDVDEWVDALQGALECGGSEQVHVLLVGSLGALVVLQDPPSSVGLMRLAARQAAAEIRHLFASTEPFVPPAGGWGPGGAPAHVAAGLAWPVWTPPKSRDPS